MKASAKDYIQIDRLAAQMDTLGLDAIVARAGINFTYLAGFAYPGTLARHLDLADSPAGWPVVAFSGIRGAASIWWGPARGSRASSSTRAPRDWPAGIPLSKRS